MPFWPFFSSSFGAEEEDEEVEAVEEVLGDRCWVTLDFLRATNGPIEIFDSFFLLILLFCGLLERPLDCCSRETVVPPAPAPVNDIGTRRPPEAEAPPPPPTLFGCAILLSIGSSSTLY